jgi:uroporphyrinogen III methyltransferase / synthase
MNSNPGKVYLVGAGPGDPGLITVKGMQCIQEADVLVYDYLASPMLLAHASPTAEKIYVGKKGGDHTLSQTEINALIVEKARGGQMVARLKGGDPFVFGRGGEEAQELFEAGISFEVVPGVTSAVAAPAYAGIPLTHRDHNSTVAFVTGHEDPTKAQSSIDWSALATGIGTLVFFMGVKNLPNIVEQLTTHGRPSSTPVALVRWGTTSKQQTVTGTLETIVADVEKAGLKAPSIIIVGGVVNLRPQLKWFEERPLFGKTVVVTRARRQASALTRRLMDIGARCLEFPTIEITAPESFEPMDTAIDTISDYEWLVFTSVNGVGYFFDRLHAKGLDSRALGHLKTAAIGPATAKRLGEFGLHSDIIPETYRAESVVAAFKKEEMTDQRVLLPRAEQARPVLPVELQKMGARVDEITAYRTRIAQNNTGELIAELENGRVDVITFTSSSTVTNFMELLPPERARELLAGVSLASIGPITTETAEKLGLSMDITADTYTIPGLCKAIVEGVDGQ